MISPVQAFRERMKYKQVVYKTELLRVNQMGKWKGEHYPHILPEDYWSLNLWEDISYQAIKHFAQSELEWHNQKHNLLSSQIMCVNTFFPLKLHPDALKPWLAEHFRNVDKVTDIDFGYTPHKDYLNEGDERSKFRTSADVAIAWEDAARRKHMLLLAFKFTERNLGECAQRNNPDRQRCLSSRRIVASPQSECYLMREWNHRYWSRTRFIDSPFLKEALTTEQYCPFRYDFFNLMRLQLLAFRIEADSRSGFDRVDCGVMYHPDNEDLLRMAHPFADERNPLKAWPTMLKKPDSFHALTMQELVGAVDGGLPSELEPWHTYLKERYGL